MVESAIRPAGRSLSILAVLGIIAALYLMRSILVPIALSLLLATLLHPVTKVVRKYLRLGPVGAAVVLFVVSVVVGLYVASLTAESLIVAATTIPADIERLSLRISDQVNDAVREHPFLANWLPEPGTIDRLGTTHGDLLMKSLGYDRLTDLTLLVGHGVLVLFLVLFLLAESEMLMPRVVRFFTAELEDARAAERTLAAVTRKMRQYLWARTVLNIGLGAAVAISLWLMGIDFALPLGVFAGLTNYIPYIGNVAGGTLPVLATLAQTGSLGNALLVAAVFLAIVTVEGYVVMPYVLGKSLDLNGTTVLVACLFWGFLWGLMGLILAMPITVSMKLVFQHVPSLNRWAELMSWDWHSPGLPESRGEEAEREGAAKPPARGEGSEGEPKQAMAEPARGAEPSRVA